MTEQIGVWLGGSSPDERWRLQQCLPPVPSIFYQVGTSAFGKKHTLCRALSIANEVAPVIFIGNTAYLETLRRVPVRAAGKVQVGSSLSLCPNGFKGRHCGAILVGDLFIDP